MNKAPAWVRPAIPGEALDDTKERRCVSGKCGAVFIRQENESAESWAHKRYCSGLCYAANPSIPKPPLYSPPKNQNHHLGGEYNAQQ